MQRKKDFSFIFERKNCKVNEFAADFVNWKQSFRFIGWMAAVKISQIIWQNESILFTLNQTTCVHINSFLSCDIPFASVAWQPPLGKVGAGK